MMPEARLRALMEIRAVAEADKWRERAMRTSNPVAWINFRMVLTFMKRLNENANAKEE